MTRQTPVEPMAVQPRVAFKKLGISEYLGWKLIHNGTIPATRLGERRLLISVAALDRLLADPARLVAGQDAGGQKAAR